MYAALMCGTGGAWRPSMRRRTAASLRDRSSWLVLPRWARSASLHGRSSWRERLHCGSLAASLCGRLRRTTIHGTRLRGSIVQVAHGIGLLGSTRILSHTLPVKCHPSSAIMLGLTSARSDGGAYCSVSLSRFRRCHITAQRAGLGELAGKLMMWRRHWNTNEARCRMKRSYRRDLRKTWTLSNRLNRSSSLVH